MGSSSVWVAMRFSGYKSFKKEYDFELVDEVTQDELYGILESYGLGGGFVYDDTFDTEWEKTPEYLWFSTDQEHLKIEKLDSGCGDVAIWFPSAKSKQEWFRSYFEAFRKRLIDELDKLTLKSYSSYDIGGPDWRIKDAYSGCWDGRVLAYDSEGRRSDFDTPMNFLRQMKPREKWVIAGKEWRYK